MHSIIIYIAPACRKHLISKYSPKYIFQAKKIIEDIVVYENKNRERNRWRTEGMQYVVYLVQESQGNGTNEWLPCLPPADSLLS